MSLHVRSSFVAALLALASWAGDTDIFAGAPAAPPGYDTYEAARAAVMKGEVKAINAAPEIPDSISVTKDIPYHSGGDPRQALDLFVPKNLDAPAPLLVFIHGGGWRAGNKGDYLSYNVHFAELGYVTASVGYRLSPANHFPSAVQDVKCAIAWLREHAKENHIDPERVAVVGGSAGGHLALMAGYANAPELECPDAPKGVSTRVQAVVNFYGVVDCTVQRAIEAREVQDFIGKPYSEAKEAYESASPLIHLTKDDPPTLTFHGTIDELVPIGQADTLHAKLTELGIPNYYDKVVGWPHSMDVAKPVNDRCRYIMEKFFEAHLQAAK